MKKLILSLAACATMLAASAQTTWKMGDNTFNVDTLFHATTGPGVTTTGLRLSGADANVNTIKTNIFYSTVDLTNPNLEIRGVQAKDGGNTTETVKAMGERKTAQGKGTYLCGTNGDFFNMGGNPIYTNGHSMADGTLYNMATSTDWQAWATYAVVNDKKDVKIQMGVNAAKTITFPNGDYHSYHINGGRWDNYLVIYTPDSISTGTNKWGCECTMKLTSGTIKDGDAVFEITSTPIGNMADGNGNMEVPRDGYVLSGVGDARTMMLNLKIGDKVTMGQTVTYNGKTINPNAIIGGCTMLVTEGEVADEKYFSSAIIEHFTSNQARTAIGYNQDRTKMIFLVADKYSANKASDDFRKGFGETSTGFVNKRIAQIMVNLGCYTAMNYDGGGSSQLYNHKLGIRNIPYGEDTYLRPVANGLFAVSTCPEDDQVAALEVMQKNVKLANGEKFTPTVYGYNKYGVLVNTNVTGFTFTVAPSLGATAGTTFTANATAGSTHGVVALGDIKCAVRILTNGGGAYVTSGDDKAPLEVGAPYEADEAMGTDKEPFYLAERWHFVTDKYNDGWDATAPNWDADSIKAKSCPRFATARNGRFYTVDMVTMSIAEITPEGELIPRYKLPALTETYNGVADYYGCAISSDDAGNFLIGHLFTKTDTYRVWTVYSPKSGKAKHFAIDLGDEKSNGRIDNIGRVIGDLTVNAYAFVAPKATGAPETNKTLILHFKGATDVNGNYDVDLLTLEHSFDGGLWLAGSGNQNSTIQPKYASIDEMKDVDPKNAFYWYSKAAGVAQSTVDLFTREGGVDSQNYALDWNNHSGLNGFDTFMLGGKRYFVVNYASADEANTNPSGQHIIVKDELGTTVAEWNNPDFTSTAGFNTITAVPIDANNVNIYIYNCTGNHNGLKDQAGKNIGAIAGTLLRVSNAKIVDEEPTDITPDGLNFANYEDGDLFKIYSTETNGAWSGPAGFYHTTHPEAFEENGQLTSFMYRGMGTDLNNQEKVDAAIQPMVVVRKVSDNIGKALVINEQWSPMASKNPTWACGGFNAAQPQFSFFVRNEDIKANTEQRHYVRVRVVYNILERGCHYAADLKAGKNLSMIRSIYATHENNWVVPANDHVTGTTYGDTGMSFAQFEDETGRIEDLPANPVVRTPDEGEIDPWDEAHGGVTDSHANGRPPYIMNADRFRVYEFDTYIDNPSKATVSVQLNIADRNATFIIKEIKFTDLGTDEAAATYLNKRNMGWTYYNEYTPAEDKAGLDEVVVDEVEEAAPAVYYNLQGVQVKNPSNGIYIVRQGNKVSKVLVK